MKTQDRIIGSSVIAFGIAIHFFGYECSRAASIALLASKESGLGTDALTYTVALGSPASALVLYLYARSIRLNGARYTLRVSEAWCMVLFLFIIRFRHSTNTLFEKFLVVFFYCFREIYVSLLSTQYWSFIASVLDKNTSDYLVRFTAVVSIASAVGGYCVQLLVGVWGVRGLLITTIISLAISSLCAELATIITYDGEHEFKTGEKNKPSKRRPSMHNLSVWKDSWELMKKYRILKLLYVEAIAHQACSNMLNMMFYEMLRRNIAESSQRAVVVGHFFAIVNTVACALHLFILPMNIVCQESLHWLLPSVPIVISLLILLAFIQNSSMTIMFAFGTLKVLEYSVMSSATEMMYIPFNEDVRYLGKELVKFFGGKLGKSGSSLTLSALNAHFNPSLSMQSCWAGFLAFSWAITMYYLSHYLQYHHPNAAAAAHKKDDELPEPEPEDVAGEVMSSTTSESNLSVVSKEDPPLHILSTDDSDVLCDISPPDAWMSAQSDESEAPYSSNTSNVPRNRRVSFERPLRRAASSANSLASHPDSDTADDNINAKNKKNLMLRIGSTHVSLQSLGGDDDAYNEDLDESTDEVSPARSRNAATTPTRRANIFEKTGFYW